jgi:hypothetical protein
MTLSRGAPIVGNLSLQSRYLLLQSQAVRRRIEAHQIQTTTGGVYFFLRIGQREENGGAGYYHLDAYRVRPDAVADFGAGADLPAVLGEEVRSGEQGPEVLVRAWAI